MSSEDRAGSAAISGADDRNSAHVWVETREVPRTVVGPQGVCDREPGSQG